MVCQNEMHKKNYLLCILMNLPKTEKAKKKKKIKSQFKNKRNVNELVKNKENVLTNKRE